jgi:hypothetical protein
MNLPHYRKWLTGSVIGLLLFPINAFAASGDLYIGDGDVWLSDTTVVYGQTVRVYALVNNDTSNDLLGSVKFVVGEEQIGADQAVSVLAGKTDTVFVDWTPTAGNYTIMATIYPWESSADDTGNNSLSLTTTVDYDADSDGVGNAQDPNDDNDEAVDGEDAFPYDDTETKDTDEDGIGNNADTDDDNDSIEDSSDALPENAAETGDTDGDGMGNNEDTDDDNDGVSDNVETTGEPDNVTDPENPDTDGDGYLDGPGTDTDTSATEDGADAFPTDPEEWTDTDADGEGDNADTDDDNDTLTDEEDPYPTNPGPVVVFEEYTEEEWLVLDASNSYDPDGATVTYQWWDSEGNLMSEEAILTLPINERGLPASLTVIDETGESRSLELNVLGSIKYLEAMGLALISALAISLAILLYFKYTPSAPAKASVSTGSKGPSGSKKSSPSKRSRKS